VHAIVCPIVRARSRRCVDIRITNVLFVHRATRLFRRSVDRFRRATDSVSIVSSSWSERHAQKSRPIIRDRFARGVAGPPTFLCVHTRGGGAGNDNDGKGSDVRGAIFVVVLFLRARLSAGISNRQPISRTNATTTSRASNFGTTDRPPTRKH